MMSTSLSEMGILVSLVRATKRYHLTVNGERAKSKRTGNTFEKDVVGVRRRDNFVEFTMEDGKIVKLSPEDADMDALSQQFGDGSQDLSLDDLQPIFHSTPKPLAERRRKRQKTQGSRPNTNTEGKLKGVVEVPLSSIKKAPVGLTLVEASHSRTETFKKILRASESFHLPLLPVMVVGEFMQENAEDGEYQLLGGLSIFEALIDITSEERYARYRNVMVRVHQGLNPMEALQVGAMFQQEQCLLTDEAPTLQAKVHLCRRVLYTMHNIDDTEEPPTNVDLDWRPQAAAALGVVASSRKELKPLETTFQMALYTKRCFEKLLRLFSWHEEQYGKPLKQSIFVFLQGLAEADKFDILSKLVNGAMKVDQVKLEAAWLKKMGTMKQVFMQLTSKRTWEECCHDFPAHTQPSALDQFLDLDFKKAVPVEFIEFIKETEYGSSTFESLRAEPVSLAIVQVESMNARHMKRLLGNIKTGSENVAVLADGLELAARWQAEMRKQGFNLQQETSVLKETHVCHLIASQNKDGRKLPRILGFDQVFQTLVETYTMPGDTVGIGGDVQGLRDIVDTLERECRVIHMGKSASSSADSDATDLDVTD